MQEVKGEVENVVGEIKSKQEALEAQVSNPTAEDQDIMPEKPQSTTEQEITPEQQGEGDEKMRTDLENAVNAYLASTIKPGKLRNQWLNLRYGRSGRKERRHQWGSVNKMVEDYSGRLSLNEQKSIFEGMTASEFAVQKGWSKKKPSRLW